VFKSSSDSELSYTNCVLIILGHILKIEPSLLFHRNGVVTCDILFFIYTLFVSREIRKREKRNREEIMTFTCLECSEREKRRENKNMWGPPFFVFSTEQQRNRKEKWLNFVVPFLHLYLNYIYDLLSFLQIANM